MRRLLLVFSSLFGLSAALAFWGLNPRPKVVKPDPRYGIPAIKQSVIDEAQSITVLMSNEGIDGRWRGTGILLDSTTVLTCAHMLSQDYGAKELWIYPYPGDRVVRATVISSDKVKDLALLRLTTPVMGRPTPRFAEKINVGEPILVIGNINGFMLWFVSYGIISGEYGPYALTDATIHGGNSGGPWLNARGEIVALTDVGWENDGGQSIGISGGVPAADLQKFIARARK